MSSASDRVGLDRSRSLDVLGIWVDAAVRMRDERHVFHNEAFVVPRKRRLSLRKIEQARRVLDVIRHCANVAVLSSEPHRA